jgi:hypothetical protein
MDVILADEAAQSSRPSAGDVLAHLQRALDIIDERGMPADIGARVQEAVEAVAALVRR